MLTVSKKRFSNIFCGEGVHLRVVCKEQFIHFRQSKASIRSNLFQRKDLTRIFDHKSVGIRALSTMTTLNETYIFDFIAPLAESQSSLCHGELSVVRASVRTYESTLVG